MRNKSKTISERNLPQGGWSGGTGTSSRKRELEQERLK